MDSLLLRYFREQAQVTSYQITIPSAAYGQMLPSNQLRYGLVVPNSNVGRILFAFGDVAPPNTAMVITAQYVMGAINEDVWGEVIRLPLWMLTDNAPYVAQITELSYDPGRYREMEAHCREYLSRTRTS